MELNEACEKAARYWLGWEWREWLSDDFTDGFGWLECCNGTWHPIFGPDEGDGWLDKPESITLLASPWAMDLLLNAADDKSWDRDGIRYWIAWEWNCSPSDLYSHRFQIFLCRVKLQSDENESCEEIASGEAKSDDKYNAIVYAFAKAADVLEEL